MTPRVGVGVFVYRSREDRRFLLGQRKGSIGAGTWSLAGGHLEHNETFEQCVVREVREETDLEISDVRYLTAVETFFEEEDRHYVTVFMTGVVESNKEGEIPEPKLMEPDKCDGWSWHSFQDVLMREIPAKPLFLPIKNLLAQRPDVCAALKQAEITTTNRDTSTG